MSGYDEMRLRDLEHVWHPYTDIETLGNKRFPIIESADGVFLKDIEGNEILDGISSWWCVNLGHGNRRILKALEIQAGILQNSITGGMSHPGIVNLAEKLAEIAPGDLSRVYFASDGACAVEAAMRIALQYWWNLGEPRKNRMISLEGGYHGDTLGCVGLGYIPRFHRSLDPVLRRSLTAESPHCFHCTHGMSMESCDLQCFESIERVVKENADTVAAVIVEPVCQCAAGMRIYPPGYVTRLRKLCDENRILLILDEIAVGFQRTGAMFASELAEVVPDIMCLGKGLTAGYLPMSAVVVSDEIYDSFRSTDDMDRTFYHGHTFSGNPLSCAVAIAALEEYLDKGVIQGADALSQILFAAFDRFGSFAIVHDATSRGCMSSLEIADHAGGADTARYIAVRALEKGLLLRPLGPVIYLWPPLTAKPEELEQMIDILAELLEDSTERSGAR